MVEERERERGGRKVVKRLEMGGRFEVKKEKERERE